MQRSQPEAGAKPWLKSYPAKVPAEIAPPTGSIGDLLVRACKQYAGRPAFTCMGKSISFGDLERQSAAFGAWLQSKGLAKGARVAVMMPNVLQYPVAMMGILRAGYIVVNVNPLYTPRELEHQLKDSGAEAIVILENFAKTLQAVIAKTPVKHVVVATMGDMLGVKGLIVNFVVRRVKKLVPAWSLPGHVAFNAALRDGAGRQLKPVKVDARGRRVPAIYRRHDRRVQGRDAAPPQRHRQCRAAQPLGGRRLYGEAEADEPGLHLRAAALPHLRADGERADGHAAGRAERAHPQPARHSGLSSRNCQKYQFHIFPGLNTLFNALLNNEDFRKLDFKPLVLSLGGGMAVQRGVAERWKKVTGNNITEGYGLSETSPVATANKVSGTEFTGTIGLPLPSTDISIRDDDGNELPSGEVGEICIRGPQVMAGYWQRPDETAKVMTADGFFKSGDMGFMDEKGYTKIVDRKKDMILVSGFNVYPNELEEVVALHPGVLEVAAIGVPDEHSGEAPKLFVVQQGPEPDGRGS